MVLMTRTLLALGALAALVPTSLSAQRQWQTLSAPTSQRLSVDLRSLTVVGPVVSVVVRTPTGAGMYEIQPHEVRCTDLSVRLGPARSYDADAPGFPSLSRPNSSAAWTQYGSNSDGQLAAAAICSLARKRGLLWSI
jgi:hypothetical protein